MHYTDEDYRHLYNDQPKVEQPSRWLGWIVAIFLAVLLGVAGAFDYASAIDADTAEKEALAASIQFRLDFPLNWSATVTQSGPGIREVRTRYYVKKEKP